MTSKPLCVVFGAGGHARVVLECLQLTGAVRIYGVLDPAPHRAGTTCGDVPILGGDELLPMLSAGGVDSFVVGIGGTGDNGPRRRLFELGVAHGLTALVVTHPQAICSPSARIGAGAQLFAGSIVNPGAVLGRSVIVNSRALVEHDCLIGDFVHVASGACLTGNVRVGDEAHIGAGAVVRQGITIGPRALVAAGAVVVRDVPADMLAVGVPARCQPRVTRDGRATIDVS